MLRYVVSLAVALAAAGSLPADDKVPDPPKADPKDTPLELTVTGKTTRYTLDTGGLSGADYKKKVSNTDGPPASAPAVDLTVEVKNTSDKPVRVWVSGDPVVLTLELRGRGAVNVQPLIAFTQEFRAPQDVEIAAGKSHAFPVKSLVSGFRSASVYSYWTEPGEYELVATLKTGMQPAPKGAQDFDGYGVVTIRSAPLKLTVEAKK